MLATGGLRVGDGGYIMYEVPQGSAMGLVLFASLSGSIVFTNQFRTYYNNNHARCLWFDPNTKSIHGRMQYGNTNYVS